MVQDRNLHVHSSESGDHVGHLTSRQLRMKDEDVILGVWYGEGDVLHLCVWNSSTSQWRLVAYQVRQGS